MIKILLTGASCSINKGAAAMVVSTAKMLREFIPDAKFTMLSKFSELDCKQCEAYSIEVVDYKPQRSNQLKMSFCLFRCALWSILLKYLHLNVNTLINEKVLQEYAKSDIIIDLSGDTLNGGLAWSIVSLGTILLGISIGKPVVVYPQSIGPFTKSAEFLARFTLNKVKFIAAREEITRNYLKEIGVDKVPVYLTADIAFLLQPPSHERVCEMLLKEGINENNRPIIGISISQSIAGYSKSKNPEETRNSYVIIMAKAVDYLTDALDATVVFVPHVIGPGEIHDDRVIGNELLTKVNSKQKVISIINEYTPEELKGIIGVCDLFIGARMHANIAATSMHVPTIAIAYSHKTYGIMEMLGQGKYVLDIKELDYKSLISKINDAWENREKIKNDLRSKIEVLQEQTLLNCKLIKDILDHK